MPAKGAAPRAGHGAAYYALCIMNYALCINETSFHPIP